MYELIHKFSGLYRSRANPVQIRDCKILERNDRLLCGQSRYCSDRTHTVMRGGHSASERLPLRLNFDHYTSSRLGRVGSTLVGHLALVVGLCMFYTYIGRLVVDYLMEYHWLIGDNT